jgi:ACT domain
MGIAAPHATQQRRVRIPFIVHSTQRCTWLACEDGRVSADRTQDLRVLDGRYVIEHSDDTAAPTPGPGWLALVFGPDGRTGIRRAGDGSSETWAAVWSGDQWHDPQATGMLSAIVAPLAATAVPVMVASTFHADLVLVPAVRLDEAVGALRDAGHRVVV